MSEEKIVEGVGHARVDMQKLFRRALAEGMKPQIARVHLVRRDAQGNVIEEKVIDGDDR